MISGDLRRRFSRRDKMANMLLWKWMRSMLLPVAVRISAGFDTFE
jgi:hypothetical protein